MRLAGHVAGRLAVRVGLDHVRAGVDRGLLAVGRGGLRVVLLRELLRDRDRDRHPEGARGGRAGALREVQDERVLVRRLDAGDLLIVARLLRDALDVAQVDAGVAVGDVGREGALERVLDVLRLDLAADGLGEHDPVLELDRDGLAVRADLRLALGEVRHGLRGVLRRVRVQAAVDRVHDPDRVRVVRLARIHVVDVTAGQDGQLAALLALGGIGHVVDGGAREELVGDALVTGGRAALVALRRCAGITALVVVAAARADAQKGRHGRERKQGPPERPRHELRPFVDDPEGGRRAPALTASAGRGRPAARRPRG